MLPSFVRVFIGLVTMSLLLMGCDRFVNIKTQGNLVPNQPIYYRYLLNNTDAYEQTIRLGDIAADDIAILDSVQQADLVGGDGSYTYFTNTYTWQADIFPLGSANEEDTDWNTLYATILNCNTITSELPGTTGSEAEKAPLMAEAKVHRASAYLMLVNQYGKPYGATSSTDPGVPLLLAQNVTQRLDRASVATVYQQILTDLKQAVSALPTTQRYTTLPSKASAYGLLARTYLYMNNHAQAGLYADSALALRSTLNQLSALSDVSQYPRRIDNPEILLSKTAASNDSYAPTAFRLSDELGSLLGVSDLRYQLFTSPASKVSADYTGRYFTLELSTGETRNVGPSVPEMMLIKAEALARAGDASGAMRLVNTLRRSRFKPADYRELSLDTAQQALVAVINERRREFFCRMLRWWDMRRLENEAPFARTITRTFQHQLYTLAPGSPRYTLPIARSLIRLNPEIIPNM